MIITNHELNTLKFIIDGLTGVDRVKLLDAANFEEVAEALKEILSNTLFYGFDLKSAENYEETINNLAN